MEQPDDPQTHPLAASPHEVVRDGVPPRVPAGVFRGVFEASFGLSILTDGDGRIRALSDAATDLYPARRAQLGTSVADAPWWDDPDRVRESLRLARSGLLDRFYTAVTRSGAGRTFLVDVQTVDGPEGQDWILLEARDVTTLLATETQLHEAFDALERERSHLQAVLDATPNAIAATDTEGVVGVVNRSVQALGLARDQGLSVGGSVLEHGGWAAHWRRALDGETVTDRVHRAEATDHPAQWLDLVFAPVRTRGRVTGALVTAADVTVQVRAEELQSAAERGAVAPFVVAADGTIAQAAPTLPLLFGTTRTETLETLTEGLADREAIVETLAAALAQPGSAFDLRARRADDDRTVWLRGRSVTTDGETRLVGVAYGVSSPRAEAVDRWASLLAEGGWGDPAGHARVDPGVLAPPPDPDVVAARLDSLRRSDLLVDGASPVFDALTRLASMALGVPISLVSLVDHDRQVFVGQTGLSDAEVVETPLSHSFCQHVANERRPLVVADARESARLADNGAIADLGVVAYLGVPVASPDGHVIGALCAIDSQPHPWTDDDVRLLSSLAEAVTAEVAARHPRPSPDP